VALFSWPIDFFVGGQDFGLLLHNGGGGKIVVSSVPGPNLDLDPPGSEIIWPQGSGSAIIIFRPDRNLAPDPDPPLFHTKLKNMF